MVNGSGSMRDYINAVKFCAHLENEDNVTEAYKKARAGDKFVQDRWNSPSDSNAYRELTSAASRYRKVKMVRETLTQSDMPLYLMFQGARYQAVATLANEMSTAMYSKDRISAADKLLTHVKPPENSIELNIGMHEDVKSAHDETNKQLASIAASQLALLRSGKSISEVQKLNININEPEGVIDV